MATTITVTYPNVEDATFDLDYYLKTHLPLVSERFTPYGLTGWRVLKVVGTPDDQPAPYSIICTLDFATAGQFKAAIAGEGTVVMGDVPNFSNKAPVIVIGDLVGTS